MDFKDSLKKYRAETGDTALLNTFLRNNGNDETYIIDAAFVKGCDNGPWNTFEEAEEYGKQFFSSPQTKTDHFCVIKRGKFSVDGSPLAIMIEAKSPMVTVFVYQDGFWHRDDNLVPVEQRVMKGDNS